MKRNSLSCRAFNRQTDIIIICYQVLALFRE